MLVGLLLGLSQQAAALTEGLVDYIDAVSLASFVLACPSPDEVTACMLIRADRPRRTAPRSSTPSTGPTTPHPPGRRASPS